MHPNTYRQAAAPQPQLGASLLDTYSPFLRDLALSQAQEKRSCCAGEAIVCVSVELCGEAETAGPRPALSNSLRPSLPGPSWTQKIPGLHSGHRTPWPLVPRPVPYTQPSRLTHPSPRLEFPNPLTVTGGPLRSHFLPSRNPLPASAPCSLPVPASSPPPHPSSLPRLPVPQWPLISLSPCSPLPEPQPVPLGPSI